jgi:hypothetical protein
LFLSLGGGFAANPDKSIGHTPYTPTQVERVQRANFIHFFLLCLVPTALLVIVIAAIVSDDGDCGSSGDDELLACEMEPRSFANAFTTTCICDAVRIPEGGVRH